MQANWAPKSRRKDVIVVMRQKRAQEVVGVLEASRMGGDADRRRMSDVWVDAADQEGAVWTVDT